MKKAVTVDLKELGEEPYLSVICYPRPSEVELKGRLEELRGLGVTALEFGGEKQVFDVQVLGKGCVGVVTMAYRDGEKVALKIRRVDADRTDLQHEAEMLKRANSVNVGPSFLCVSQNFLLMRFVDGVLFPEWLKKPKGKARIRRVLRQVLEQCWRLDREGLDHGELSHAPKHVIVNRKDEPFIVDFETASIKRKPSNVTSICQFLFVGGAAAGEVSEKLDRIGKNEIIEALRCYKTSGTRQDFEKVLAVCNV